jgi:flagella basal body P-ring formation protein FlgA
MQLTFTMPRLNPQWPRNARWRFSILAILWTGFARSLFADEPVLLQTNTPAIEATTNTSTVRPPARRDRAFSEQDLLQLLTGVLQQDYVKDRGELELRMNQPWKSRTVPDDVLTLKILDVPTMGVTPVFVVRFELHSGVETVGTWQVPVQARIWREVWTAQSALKRGEPVSEADLALERRDVLAMHEPLAEFSSGDTTLELAESVQAGSLLLGRMVKTRPVIHRGQAADALVRDGVLSITMKVEALEDGAPGQLIRVRNFQSRRDFPGKVMNEQTILVTL